MEIGVIGLGRMGSTIAARLLDAGHELTVYNRTEEKAEALLEQGAMLAHDPSGAATGDVVITMLADDKAMEDVVFGSAETDEGFLDHQAAHTIHMAMGTISIRLAQRLAAASTAKNRMFVSSTVLGRPDVAERGELVIMAAGDRQSLDKCKPVFDAIGKVTHIIGEKPEQANIAKLAANFMISSMIESYAEAFALIRKNGLDQQTFLKIMATEFFQSPVYEKYGTIIANENYSSGPFTIKMQEKDTRLLIAAAIDSQVPMPFANDIENAFLTAIGRGMGDLDPCAIAKLAAENAGVLKK